MSVAVYDQDELEGLWHACGGGEDLGDVIGALAYANRAAFLLSYAEDATTVYPFSLEQPRPYEGFTRDPIEWADNLLYNCISNGGANFAPEDRARNLVHAAIEAASAKVRKAHYARLHERHSDLTREIALDVLCENTEALAYKRAQSAHVQKRMAALSNAGF